MKENKILVSDSRFLECVDELATQITEMNYGADTYGSSSEVGQEGVMIFQEEAQDYYNEMFDEYETLLNNTLNVWNKQGENKYPFKEGDDYYTIENGEVVWSCWDFVSEDIHDDNPNIKYYKSMKDAIRDIISEQGDNSVVGTIKIPKE